MHETPPSSPLADAPAPGYRWYRELNRYHWFVLLVAALGWLFDTMDQQLFNLARMPAMNSLLRTASGEEASQPTVAFYGGLATAIFLIGWATGGLAFGVLGDRIGRARTMLWTILIYSLCTGLSALSIGFWDFAFYRFLTGLGVGGEFAVGVALVAEAMPARARPFALGMLQAFSAVGNIAAATISIVLGQMQEAGSVGSAWRVMFLVGTLPALLAIVIRRRLKEPERWQAMTNADRHVKAGSYRELFGHPVWRRHAIIGLLMAFSGVVGLWGIGFFSIDLTRLVLRKEFENVERQRGEAERDKEFVRLAVRYPEAARQWANSIQPGQLLGSSVTDRGPALAWGALSEAWRSERPADRAAAVQRVSETVSADHDLAWLTSTQSSDSTDALASHAERIAARSKSIDGRLTLWAGITSMMLNIGAFFGMYAFSVVTDRIGRRPAFAMAFASAMFSTAAVFWYMETMSDVLWMIPVMGFCLLSLFGGYAIYFPELFPTHLRSTGTSFCYNVGRFVAATGPFTLGLLTSRVFAETAEPMRYAGVSMCLVFLIGLLVLPFAPETRGKALPE